MKAKLVAFVKAAYAKAPFPAGLALGYFGQPVIKLALGAVVKLVKFL